MLDFWNYKFLTVGRIVSVELRNHAKFRGDRSNRCRDIWILDFSRWRQTPSWIFLNFTFLTMGTVKKDELRHYAKFCRNRSNHGGDMSVFDFSRWRSPPSWIFEISKFLTVGTVKRVELRQHAKFRQNRSSRGWDITIFIFFQDNGSPPSWIRNACVETTHAGHFVVFYSTRRYASPSNWKCFMAHFERPSRGRL